MNVVIITPSLARKALLERLSHCLEHQDIPTQECIIVQDVLEFENPCSIVPWVNRIVDEHFHKGYDVVCYLADYCQPQKNFVRELVKHFYLRRDFDCLCDIPMINYNGAKPGCFWAIGRRFWERFQGNPVWCPEYYHFYVDTELYDFANSLFRASPLLGSGVIVDHPNLRNRTADKAHLSSRAYKEFDNETSKLRKEAGLLWGNSFKRVRENLPWEQ